MNGLPKLNAVPGSLARRRAGDGRRVLRERRIGCPGWAVFLAALLWLGGPSPARAVGTSPCPSNKVVDCGSTWTFDPPTTAGSCTVGSATVTVLNTVTNAQGCLTFITQTWQVTDACGNSITCSQTVTVADRTPPVPSCAADKTVVCGTTWTFDTPTAIDACCGTNVTIQVFSTVTNGSCAPTITRTWELTDCCSNHVFCSQSVTALDTTPPVITCPPNKTIPAGAMVSFDPPIATDSCCGNNVKILDSGTVTNAGPCGPVLTRTWTALDCCGNSSRCSQSITLSGGAAPRLVSVYAPCGGTKITLGLSQPVTAGSAQNLANYSVNCAGPLAITNAVLAGPQVVCLFLSQSIGGSCSITVGNLQDACGNAMPLTPFPFQCTVEPCVRGSAGLEYWLTFPGNHGPDPADPPQPRLYISGLPGTVGTVDMPGLPTPFQLNFTIPGSGDVTVPLPLAADLGEANDQVQTNGVHVVAAQPVAVHGLSYLRFSTDGYLGLPLDALGNSYRVMAYRNLFIEAPELAGSQLAVVGTVDGTTVTIVPRFDVGLHAGGLPYNVTLMKGQTYQLRQSGEFVPDLSGALVLADQPVAVFGGHPCANIPDTNVFFCNYLVEQLPPTDLWGTNFITVTFTNRVGGDTVRVLAMLTNTVVQTNGVPVAAPLQQGEYAEVRLAANAQITSTKPILVAQYAHSSDFDLVPISDPFMTLVPPTSLHGTSFRFQSPPDFPANFVNLAVPVGSTAQIFLDANPIPANLFSTIGASGYAAARLAVSPGPHALTSSGGAFGATVYGWNQFDAYGFPAGTCVGKISPPTVAFSCPPASVTIPAAQGCIAVVPNLSSLVGNGTNALLITQVPAPGTVIGPGNYSVAMTIFGPSGVQQTCAVTLIVQGMVCPANRVTNCTTSSSQIVNFQPVACTQGMAIACAPPSGSAFPVGVTTVNCTGLIPGSLPQQCAFTVTVNCLSVTITPLPAGLGFGQTLQWSGTGQLYRATNVQGPYLPIPGSTSPFTNRGGGGQGFFRVGP